MTQMDTDEIEFRRSWFLHLCPSVSSVDKTLRLHRLWMNYVSQSFFSVPLVSVVKSLLEAQGISVQAPSISASGTAMSFEYDVCVVGGCGHVGLPLAITFARRGLKGSIYDINDDKAKQVAAGEDALPRAGRGARPPRGHRAARSASRTTRA